MNINIPSSSLPAGAGAAARLLHEAQVLLQSERPKSPAVTELGSVFSALKDRASALDDR
jgi:hypothetical protein